MLKCDLFFEISLNCGLNKVETKNEIKTHYEILTFQEKVHGILLNVTVMYKTWNTIELKKKLF